MEARQHPRHQERLRALHSYAILDTDREQAFDDVVALTAELCGAPIAVINLIDAERQWFKAEVGLGVRETPLATSLCAHVILQDEFTEIEDTLADPRMADNPLCTGNPGLRFYAGALLKSADDLPLGTLCVLDRQPRRLTDLQRRSLRVLADQVMAQLNQRRAMREVELLGEEVDHRMRNALGTLLSLALLESEAAATPEAREALERMLKRIRGVGSLHEALGATRRGGYVDLGAYVERIGDYLRDLAPAHVQVTVEAHPILIQVRYASPLGILLNELASNAFRHAFTTGSPDGGMGEVALSMRRLTDGQVEVVCTDNGKGMNVATEYEGAGMRIIELVCAQLDGEFRFQNRTGSKRGLRGSFVFKPEAATLPTA